MSHWETARGRGLAAVGLASFALAGGCNSSAAPPSGAPNEEDAGSIADGAADSGVTTGTDAGGVGVDGANGGDGESTANGCQAPSSGGTSVTPPSCAPGGLGMTNCGPDGTESCCTSLEVKGGTFDRTYTYRNDGNDGGPYQPTNPATICGFSLDKYLVTVGRFRQFVAAWNQGSGWTPAAGSGKHAYLNGGQGLTSSVGGYESGWSGGEDGGTNWTQYVDPTDENLLWSFPTWTTLPGTQENLPINNVNWFEAYAFCIWDGGFLPSAVEWQYAAAGGSQLRKYPWGSADPGTGNQYAIYDCLYMQDPQNCPSQATPGGVALQIAPVGTALIGAGLWGHLDLAGEVWEWLLDNGQGYNGPCDNCAVVSPAPGGLMKGGTYIGSANILLTESDDLGPISGDRDSTFGFRCARSP